MRDAAPTLNFQFQMLTPADVCWVLDVGESTEAAWRERKLISFFRQGRLVRYTPEAVMEFIARNTVRARGQLVNQRISESVSGQISELDWRRIERLIADQARAQAERLKAEGERLKAA